MTMIRETLRVEYLKRSEEIHRTKTENKIHPRSEHWPRYLAAKDEASLILTATRIVKLFPNEIKELLESFIFDPKAKRTELFSGRSTKEYLQKLDFETNRRQIRNKIFSNKSKIKPHCHKKRALKMIKYALKYIRKLFAGKNVEELFYEKPNPAEFCPQA